MSKPAMYIEFNYDLAIKRTLKDCAKMMKTMYNSTRSERGEPSFEETEALNKQVSGSHYKDSAIQPIQYIHANKLDFCEGNVVKYITRWRKKDGIKDLEKAKHYIELLIEMEKKDDKTL